jgi:hypothetical protein
VDGKLMIVKLEQDEKHSSPSCVIPSFKIICLKDEHPTKHREPIISIVDGKLMIVKLEQDEKHSSHSCEIPSFKIICVKDEHP